MEVFQIICAIAAVILGSYYYFTSTYDFWKSRGVRGPRPILFFGNCKELLLWTMSLSDFLMKICNNYKDEPLIGIFENRTPILMIKDLNLIKDVLIKDFTTFANRDFLTNIKPLSQHLFSLEAKRWRPLRAKLSPAFTSGKLKEMFCLISECADHLIQYVEKITSKNEPVECRELMSKYGIDVIGRCAFGIEMNALLNENSEFRKIARKITNPNWFDVLLLKIDNCYPRLSDMLYHILPQKKTTKFFMHTVMENINYREMNHITKNDFIDILRVLKRSSEKLGDFEITDSLLVSQAFVFFVAGFDTSSSAVTNTLYELALNKKIQDRLRKEIDEAYTKYDGNFTYNNIKQLDYLDKVFKESLRKYPPVGFIARQSMSSYTFNGTKVSIPKNQKIWISTYTIHRDPSIYPKPDVFDPERFNEEAVQSRHPMSFLPFGSGPRNCIGGRFALYQSKIALIKILRNYEVETCEKTPTSYISDPKAYIILAPKGGLHLKFNKIYRT